MLSIGKLAAGPAAGRYYVEQVAAGREDYYSGESDGEARGGWIGAGARRLDLGDGVADDDIANLLAARNPATGRLLGQPLTEGSVAGFDLTFKAPKSISVLFGIGDRALVDQLVAGHEQALQEAIGYLERHACGGRRGHGGHTKVDGHGFVAAAFRHRSSRAGDPLLHTHVVIANRVEGPDGRWTALDALRVYRHAKTAGFLYQAALRRELTERLELSWTEVHRGTAEVQGVPSEVIESFSRRRREIERTLQERGEHSLAAVNAAALDTRKGKDYNVSIGALRATWRRQAADLGLDRPALDELLATPTAHHTPELVSLDDLTRHAPTFTRRDVLQALAAAHRDGMHVADLETSADTLLARPEAIPVERGSGERAYTTLDMLHTEHELLARVHTGRAAGWAIGRPDLVADAIERHALEGEQAEMVRSLTATGDAIQVVRAPAGAGKTRALETAREAWTRSGADVIGCALSARAAAELRDQAAIETTTIARLRVALERGHPLPRDGVLVVDEAGMVGTRDLAELARRADHARCKLVLVGDDRQLPEIDAGGAFRAIGDRCGATELSVLRRQREAEERQALGALRAGRSDEWAASLAARGRLVTATTSDALRERLVDDWWDAAHRGEDAVMIAHRRRDVDDLNERARRRLRDDDRLPEPDVTIGRRPFAVGDTVVCRHNDRDLGVINGTTGTVREADRSWLRVEADERDILLPSAYVAEHVDHGYAMTAHRAQGSTVDRAFVLGSDELHREWGYTAMSRHRDEARFYVTAPEPYLNVRARSVARQEELAETVARLFDSSEQQELALVALERTPGAVDVLDRIEDAAHLEEHAIERAAALNAERDALSLLRRGRRRDLDREADRWRARADEHHKQRAALADRLERSAQTDATAIPGQPAADPIDLEHLPLPGLARDFGPDIGM
jgi:Ti-type conjugative transfer relaxase TraA